MSKYLDWLSSRRVPLFESQGIFWQVYRGALVPATIGPFFVDLAEQDAKHLLHKSGAWFLRYSSQPADGPTGWWYIVCDDFEPGTLSSKVRNQIKRGERECTVKRVDAEWLGGHGYSCYVSACSRYNNVRPSSEASFRDGIFAKIGGPFECWGVFVGETLAGYALCIIDGDDVGTSIIKFDPAYFKHYSSYALVAHLLNHYVKTRKMTISNGNRPIAHDTRFQDILLKLGFRKQFCKLNIWYRPGLKKIIGAAFPMRALLALLPSAGPVHRLQSLLFQEELRRLCEP